MIYVTNHWDRRIDEQRKDEDAADFAIREKAQRDEFNSIRSLAGFHVIEGTLSAKRQKEVDVALAVDMLTHAFNHNMGWAHLIAGDLDFRPLVQAAGARPTLPINAQAGVIASLFGGELLHDLQCLLDMLIGRKFVGRG